MPVRLGLVGLGVIGQIHLKMGAGLPDAAFTAICDVRDEVVQDTARQFNIAKTYTDANALFANADIDGVVLALPANLRTDLALRAFANGKHVLTEKPVAMNAGEVRGLIAARGSLIAGCCSSRYRSLPSAQFVTDFIRQGHLGQIRVVRCRAVTAAGAPPTKPPPVWRLRKDLNGGGILMNWGCYDLDYLFGVLDWQVKPQRVMAQTWPVAPVYQHYPAPGSDAETHVAALVHCDNGIALSYERGEFMTTQTDEAWQIIGNKGSLRLWLKDKAGKQIYFDRATETGTISEIIWQGDETSEQQHRGPAEDFVDAICQGRQPRTTLENALLMQTLFDAIYRAADTGVCVAIS